MRWMKRTIVVLYSTALGLLPAQLLARTPNTDSTDVRIPTTRSEVENSIAVSPLNSKVLLLSNISRQGGDFAGVTSWISLDAGRTWLTTDSLVLSPSRSDPAVAIGRNGGTNGRYFVNHLDSGDYDLGIHYKNTTGGTSWSYSKVDSTGGNGVDKNHLAINNNTSGSFQNNLISAYSDGGTEVGGISARISTDNGASWSDPPFVITVSVADRDRRGVNVQWGPPASGKVYACWAGRTGGHDTTVREVGFRSSSDGGETWAAPSGGELIQQVSGFLSLPGKDMPMNIQAPVMAVNMTNGHLYIVYTTKPGGGDADVYVIKSTDEGESWGSPVRVHAATSGKDQWQPWITWDDCTGAVVVTFLDSRDFANNDRANTYMSVSYDEGSTWTDFKVSDASWDGDDFSGHYMGLTASDGIAFPVWSDDRDVSGVFKPYISPIYLWGVVQSSIVPTVVSNPELQLSVSVDWNTNLSATGTDYLVLKSPSNATYTGTATGSGTGHTANVDCPCEGGYWYYVVKSTRPGFTSRGSDEKRFLANCVD